MTEDVQDTAPAAAEPIEQAEPQQAPESAPEQTAEAPKAERTRRDSIADALAKVAEQDEAPKAEAKDAPKDAKAETGDQPRGPDGKFVAKDGEKPAEQPKDGQVEAKAADDKARDKGPLSEAPSRFSADAKAAWKDAPDPVKGEIKRAITELEGGIRQYQSVVEPLKPFMDMARQQGTTVQDALGSYVRMEQALRNPQTRGQALGALARNLGMTPADMAAALTGQQPEGGEQNAINRETIALRQHIARLEQQLGQLGQNFSQTREEQVQKEVQAFAADKPRFDELSSEILRLLQTGYAETLEEAYNAAERLNPAPQPAAPPQPAPPPQPRVARSVTGAPNAGSNPGNRQPSATRRDAIARSFMQAGLS